MHNFEVLQLPFHLGCLDRLQVQHEEKSFIAGASSMMAVLASIWGAFFSVTFKLPFHALPLLSPHPASFRSFTPWASSKALLLDTLVKHSYVTLLLDALVKHSCKTLLLDTLVRHFVLDTFT